jgi:hypothetical protein
LNLCGPVIDRLPKQPYQLIGLEFERNFYQFRKFVASLFHVFVILMIVPGNAGAGDRLQLAQNIQYKLG